MKSLKFTQDQVQNITKGQYYKTWRLFDDKDLNVGDKLQFVNTDSKTVFGTALIDKITIKRLGELSEEDKAGHKPYSDLNEVIEDFKKYYRQDVDESTVVKIVEYKFSPSNSAKQNTPSLKIDQEVKIYTDGGSRGNPGQSACAYVITGEDGNVIKIDGQYLGITTNNQAEYQAVKSALKEVLAGGVKIVHFYLDSLLVVNQMNGVFKIKNRDLWPIHQEIKEMSKQLKKITFTHIPREMNKLADEEVNRILDNTDNSGLKSNLL